MSKTWIENIHRSKSNEGKDPCSEYCGYIMNHTKISGTDNSSHFLVLCLMVLGADWTPQMFLGQGLSFH